MWRSEAEAPATPGAGWRATLALAYRREGEATRVRARHQGPLRLLRSLYPEGPAVCHDVLIHPPGGLVGGDRLEISITAGPGSHALVTTPGATRFYRSEGAVARQSVRIALDAGARLEWLPQETLCYSGCLADNRLALSLAPGAQLLGWDVVALGLPAAGQPFARGRLRQSLHWPGVWLDQGTLDAANARLMDGPLGLAGQRCLGTLFWLSGSAPARAEREQALELARACIDASPLAASAGATALAPGVVVVRVLAPLTEPAVALLRQIWAAWRAALWQMPAEAPRIWAT